MLCSVIQLNCPALIVLFVLLVTRCHQPLSPETGPLTDAEAHLLLNMGLLAWLLLFKLMLPHFVGSWWNSVHKRLQINNSEWKNRLSLKRNWAECLENIHVNVNFVQSTAAQITAPASNRTIHFPKLLMKCHLKGIVWNFWSEVVWSSCP